MRVLRVLTVQELIIESCRKLGKLITKLTASSAVKNLNRHVAARLHLASMAIRVGQTEPTASRRFRITSASILPLRPLIMGKIHKDHGRLFGNNLIIHAIELNLDDTSGKDVTAGLILVLAVNTRYLSGGIKLLRCISPFHTLEIFAWMSELNLLTSKLLTINSRIA